MDLRVVPEPAAPASGPAFRPDHRSPRWLGLIAGVLGVLTVANVVATWATLQHLLS